jgi:TonB family protein
MVPAPTFSIPHDKGPDLAALGFSLLCIGGLGVWALRQDRPLNRMLPSPVARVMPSRRVSFAVDLWGFTAARLGNTGAPGSSGGSQGRDAVDPRLLDFKRVANPQVEIQDETLPLPQRKAIPTFAGDPLLPKQLAGDSIPAGHGMGFGSDTGLGGGRPEWGITRRVNANYPKRALELGIQGYVTVQVTVDARGIPIDAKPVRGDAILMSECLRVIRLWIFEMPAKYGLSAPASFPVVYKFQLSDGHHDCSVQNGSGL